VVFGNFGVAGFTGSGVKAILNLGIDFRVVFLEGRDLISFLSE
jgi:hypothetical protein